MSVRGGAGHGFDRPDHRRQIGASQRDSAGAAVKVVKNCGRNLPDDPADSRGVLSWNAQPYDRTLHEAGSYGQLLRVPLRAAALAESARTGVIVIRLDVSAALPGGLAVYGARFGRYPIDPSVVFVLRK